MTVQLIYETHSMTTDNEAGIATGWLPGELSAQGRIFAGQLGERRRTSGLAAVFASDLARARQTAEIAFAGTGIPLHLDARLRECNYGRLNGMPVTRLAAERSRHLHVPFPDGQSYRDVLSQTSGFLRTLSTDWDDTTVLVIAHSANRWALECLLNGKRLEDLVDAPFHWQEGWTYRLPTGWTGEQHEQ